MVRWCASYSPAAQLTMSPSPPGIGAIPTEIGTPLPMYCGMVYSPSLPAKVSSLFQVTSISIGRPRHSPNASRSSADTPETQPSPGAAVGLAVAVGLTVALGEGVGVAGALGVGRPGTVGSAGSAGSVGARAMRPASSPTTAAAVRTRGNRCRCMGERSSRRRGSTTASVGAAPFALKVAGLPVGSIAAPPTWIEQGRRAQW